MTEYVFECGKTGQRFKGEAENSDKALTLCLKETGWDINKGIVYLGRAVIVDSPDFISQMDEIKFISERRL